MKTIGVFDSGVGGLSVLRALLTEIPQAHFVYVADSGYAPYGERSAQQVIDRAQRITTYLRRNHAIDALVVACNTATALAIESLRSRHPDLPIVGVEPALKPAAAITRTGHVGVLATRGTIESERFARLRARTQADTTAPLHFSCQACDGLADAIERGDSATTEMLCERYVHALQSGTHTTEPMDTLVLGCTHYPFATEELSRWCGPGVTLVETGVPVARRTRDVLKMGKAEAETDDGRHGAALTLLSTGDPAALAAAAHRWLGTQVSASSLKD